MSRRQPAVAGNRDGLISSWYIIGIKGKKEQSMQELPPANHPEFEANALDWSTDSREACGLQVAGPALGIGAGISIQSSTGRLRAIAAAEGVLSPPGQREDPCVSADSGRGLIFLPEGNRMSPNLYRFWRFRGGMRGAVGGRGLPASPPSSRKGARYANSDSDM